MADTTAEKVTVTKAALQILRHAIGLNDAGVAGPSGEFRNHFVTGEKTSDFPICEDLLRRDLVTKRSYSFDEVDVSWIYQVTDAGKAIARTPNTAMLIQ